MLELGDIAGHYKVWASVFSKLGKCYILLYKHQCYSKKLASSIFR